MPLNTWTPTKMASTTTAGTMLPCTAPAMSPPARYALTPMMSRLTAISVTTMTVVDTRAAASCSRRSRSTKAARKAPGMRILALGQKTRLAAMTPEIAPLAPTAGTADDAPVARIAMPPKKPLTRYRPRNHIPPRASSTASPNTNRNHMLKPMWTTLT
jgi:hypothetical protein